MVLNRAGVPNNPTAPDEGARPRCPGHMPRIPHRIPGARSVAAIRGAAKRCAWVCAIVAALIGIAGCDELGPSAVMPAATGGVRGMVTVDGAGASGVTVTLSSGLTTMTGADGSYSFADVARGAYTVTISGYPSDAMFSATTRAAVVASSGQIVSVGFAGSRIGTATVFGAVTSDDSALGGVVVTLAGPLPGSPVVRTTTDANGQYQFGGLAPGSYMVAISGYPTDVLFASDSSNVTVAAGEARVVSFSGSRPAGSTPLIRTSTSTVSFEHEVDATGCPQVLEGFEIENVTTEDVSVQIASNNAAIVVDTGVVTLKPGQTLRVPFAFNCSATAPFTSVLTATATSASGRTEVQTVMVSANITN